MAGIGIAIKLSTAVRRYHDNEVPSGGGAVRPVPSRHRRRILRVGFCIILLRL
jgi:hypothetical protein